MEVVLIIIAVFAALAFLSAVFSGESLEDSLVSSLGGAFAGVGCIIQLLIPVFLLLAGFWLFGKIFG